MSKDAENRFSGPVRGQILFAAGFFVVSAVLLTQIGGQTSPWLEDTRFAAQPRFWPLVGLGGMAGFAALHIWHLPRLRPVSADAHEARRWGLAFEWVIWFLAYVWLVPVIGYLPVTMGFAAALSWRMGYRSARMVWVSVGFGAVVVVLFKSVLNVKIPGAWLYEFLPGAIRNFFILNF